MHYTECPLFSILNHRSDANQKIEKKIDNNPWYKKYLEQIIIGIIITLVGGFILYLLTKSL
jgi:hypothetical protein